MRLRKHLLLSLLQRKNNNGKHASIVLFYKISKFAIEFNEKSNKQIVENRDILRALLQWKK